MVIYGASRKIKVVEYHKFVFCCLYFAIISSFWGIFNGSQCTAIPRSGGPLFWVTTPLTHTPIYVQRGERKEGRGVIIESLADQLTHKLQVTSFAKP